jgi:hypothetical protein
MVEQGQRESNKDSRNQAHLEQTDRVRDDAACTAHESGFLEE